MIAGETLSAKVRDASRSLAEAKDILPMFNERQWRDPLKAELDAASECVLAHLERPSQTIADDFANLFGILQQIDWPTDLGDREANDRLRMMRGAIGNLKFDTHAVLLHCETLGLRPRDRDLPLPDGVLASKTGRERELQALLERLLVFDDHVYQLKSEASPGKPRQQIAIVKHYIQTIRVNIRALAAAIIVGPSLDLRVMERAGSAITSSTKSLVATVNSATSKATKSLRDAVLQIRGSAARVVRGVGTVLRQVIREEGRLAKARPPRDVAALEAAAMAEFKAVGERLRTAREALGLEVEHIAWKTNVPIHALLAIESGDPAFLPPRVYVVGFVRAYAKMVGEDDEGLGRQVQVALKTTHGSIIATVRCESIIELGDASGE